MQPYYEQDGITIYKADCMDTLPVLPQFDLLLTDPPYGIGADNNKRNLSRAKAAAAIDYGDTSWDASPPPARVLGAFVGVCGKSIVWGGNYFHLQPSSCWLVWDKDNTGDFADCELAWTNRKSAVRKFRWRWNGMIKEKPEKRFHPTQKPLALMRWCLSLEPNAESVLDPFMGSGTTLVAAQLEGRKATGIEINERYCEIAAKRLEQKVLF